jgi:hypothetical protein
VVAVDTNADHFAAYRLDVRGNPIGDRTDSSSSDARGAGQWVQG